LLSLLETTSTTTAKNMKTRILLAAFAAVTTAVGGAEAFGSTAKLSRRTPRLSLADTDAVESDSKKTVGIVGRGFVAMLAAKVAARRGHKVWKVCFNGSEEEAEKLISDDDGDGSLPDNLQLIRAADGDLVDEQMGATDALIIATDGPGDVFTDSLVEYFLDPEKVSSGRLERVVAMSRNLNGKGMGFLASAARKAANQDIWDGAESEAYRVFEKAVREKAQACGAPFVTVARAGTLKGGGCGSYDSPDSYYPKRFLNRALYEKTKKDITRWQLLFDCDVRGVELAKGDVLEGPGATAVINAVSTKESRGDTSRAGIAEAMILCLDVDEPPKEFGVATKQSRTPPTDKEWDEMLRKVA